MADDGVAHMSTHGRPHRLVSVIPAMLSLCSSFLILFSVAMIGMRLLLHEIK